MAQSDADVFGSGQTIGVILGGGIVIALMLAHHWMRQRRLAALDERPPQKSKLLRPPGYSLSCRIDDLTYKWALSFAVSMACGMLAGIFAMSFYPVIRAVILGQTTLRQLVEHPQSYLLACILVLVFLFIALALHRLRLCFRYFEEFRNCRFGLRGEQAVAETLASKDVASAGFTILNDMPGDGAWNIDHVVIGPTGIFALETKARSRRLATRNQPEHVVRFDGTVLAFPWCDDRKAANQARRNAEWLQKFVAEFVPPDIIVQPVILIPGWMVETTGSYPVKAMNPNYFAKYVVGLPKKLSPEQLRPIIRRLSDRCRDLEF